LQKERGFELDEPILVPTFGHDIPLALETIEKLQEADFNENVFVLIAHDKFARDLVDHFPHSLNDWKRKGWASSLRWAFLKDFELYWKAKGVC
jgi:hypothetical protein